MNYVIAKIKDRENTYEKLYAGEDKIYDLPQEIDNAFAYNPETILEPEDWYKIENFSKSKYVIDLLEHDFRTTDYGEANKVRTRQIDYIVSFQDGNYMFQRIFKHSIMTQKRISLGDNIYLNQGEKSIVINSTPDAIYIKTSDILLFKKLSTISPIFKGIDELYREATEEETAEFLQNSFIKLADDYGVDKIKKSNRKRIAIAIDTLKFFSKKDKQEILEYTHKYYPALRYEEKTRVFCIGSEEEMKYLLWGIEQRYYTTPVTKVNMVANSVVPLQ